MDTLLTLTGITKTYPGVRALSDVSVAAAPGRVHAILGENGAGKSTLVGIAAGSIVPDSGTIDLAGEQYTRMQTGEARERGLAIVYQTPALAPSLSVLDAVLLLLPESKRPARRGASEWLTAHFADLGLVIDPRDTVASLSLREAHLVEIAAALASDPSVLILDEPTEALGPEETAWLFARIGELVARDAAIVYITHRIPEVVEIAHDLTVLRDGQVVGGGLVQDFTGDQIVELIIGRSLETTFPHKAEPAGSDEEPLLEVTDLSGSGYSNVTLTVPRGQIVGLAGVEGNGQREFMRALSGRPATSGSVRIHGQPESLRSPRKAKHAGIEFLPGDRLGEAMFGKMSIRENVVAPWLDLALPSGWTKRSREYELTQSAVGGLAVKTPTLETPVASLSGGSQQKVLLARARVGELRVLLVEDPTQGVDAGARVEIYAFLRSLADAGVAVVVLSTDAVELEGLCDNVLVFSRGRVQATLAGDEVTERSITGTAVLSDSHAEVTVVKADSGQRRGLFAVGGELQSVILLGLAIALAIVTAMNSPAFLSELNLNQMLAASSTIIIVGLAQLVMVMTGGIDLSIGSVVAVSGVIVSFFGQQGVAYFILGVVLAITSGVVVGLVNGVLITRLSVPPVIATLVTAIAVVGVAQLLRPNPTGSATPDIMEALTFSVGGVPVVLVVAVGLSVALWFVIQRTNFGRGLRATGSDSVKAVRMGVSVPLTRFSAAVISGVLGAIAGLVLYTKTGIGDANTGQPLTLTSVTVIVIAGVSIFGGSGSAIATAAAGLLLGTITASLAFLSLNRAWEYWLQGIFVLVAAVLPMVLSRRRSKEAASG